MDFTCRTCILQLACSWSLVRSNVPFQWNAHGTHFAAGIFRWWYWRERAKETGALIASLLTEQAPAPYTFHTYNSDYAVCLTFDRSTEPMAVQPHRYNHKPSPATPLNMPHSPTWAAPYRKLGRALRPHRTRVYVARVLLFFFVFAIVVYTLAHTKTVGNPINAGHARAPNYLSIFNENPSTRTTQFNYLREPYAIFDLNLLLLRSTQKTEKQDNKSHYLY